MDLTIQKTETGFDLSHPALPAAVSLSREAAKSLSAQLVGPDLVAAWKQDKCLWSPQSREPIGLWVLEDGTISLYVAGQDQSMTVDEARELGQTIAEGLAKYPVGTTVINTSPLNGYPTDPTKPPKTVASYTDLIVTAYDPSTGLYEATTADGDYISKSIGEAYLATLSDDLKTYEATQYSYTTTNPTRKVQVNAVNDQHAEALANVAFAVMNPNEGWEGARFAGDYVGVVNVVDSRTVAERNAADGWAQGTKDSAGRITAVEGGPFADDAEARTFVISTALTAGAEQRYIDAARRAEGL